MDHLVTIGLVVWNGARYLRACLDSVVKQTSNKFRVVIIDNGSIDESPSIIAEYVTLHPHLFSYIPQSENLGFAKGHNLIMSQTTTPYYMALNQDIQLTTTYVEEVCRVFSIQPQCGSVSGKILVWNFAKNELTTTVDSLGLTVTRWGQVFERGVGDVDTEGGNKVEEVFGVSGTVPVYSMQALRDVAYEGEFFDETFFSYKEDVDLAFRLRWAGYSSYVAHGAVAYHDRGAKSTAHMSIPEAHEYRKQKKEIINYNSYKNHLAILYKNYTWQMVVMRLPYIFTYEVAKFVYLLLTEFSTLKSIRVFVSLLPLYTKKRVVLRKSSKISYRQMLTTMR